MSNENEIQFIPTRYEDRGDSFYFTNEETSIIVTKHTILADNYLDALVKIDEPTDEVPNEENATVETFTEVGGENTQVEAEVEQEEPNLDNDGQPVEIKEEDMTLNPPVETTEESTTATEENNEETTDTEVEVSDESLEGNL